MFPFLQKFECGGAPLTPGFDGPAVALSGAYSSVVVVTDVTHPYIRVGDGVSLSIYLKYNLYNEPLMWVCLFDLTNLSLQKSVIQFKLSLHWKTL